MNKIYFFLIAVLCTTISASAEYASNQDLVDSEVDSLTQEEISGQLAKCDATNLASDWCKRNYSKARSKVFVGNSAGTLNKKKSHLASITEINPEKLSQFMKLCTTKNGIKPDCEKILNSKLIKSDRRILLEGAFGAKVMTCTEISPDRKHISCNGVPYTIDINGRETDRLIKSLKETIETKSPAGPPESNSNPAKQ